MQFSFPSFHGPNEDEKDRKTAVFFACPKPGSNRHVFKGHWILSPARLPIPPFGHRMVSDGDGVQIYRNFGDLQNFSRIFVFYA